jgi:hypothetical protein
VVRRCLVHVPTVAEMGRTSVVGRLRFGRGASRLDST